MSVALLLMEYSRGRMARQPTLLDHVMDIGSSSRIYENGVFQVLRRQVVANRHGENVDDLIGMWADQVRAEDTVRAAFNQHLESIGALADASRRVPIVRVLRLHPELGPLGTRLFFAQSHRGNRRDGESHARYPAVVRLLVVTSKHVGGDNASIPSRDRGQRRSLSRRVTGGIDGRVRLALQEFVELETAVLCVDTRYGQIKRIKVGDAPSSMHDHIRRDRLLFAVRPCVNQKVISAPSDSDHARFESYIDADPLKCLHESRDKVWIE